MTIKITAGQPLSDQSIGWHVEQVQAAVTKRDRGMSQLTRPDGRRSYSEVEHAERESALQAPVDQVVNTKRELTFVETQEAQAVIDQIDALQANPISRLEGDELARATNLRSFVEADLQRYRAADIRGQVDAAIAGQDRGVQSAWWHALIGRVSDLDRAAEGRQRSETEIADREQLVAMVDELATALRDPKLDEQRKQQEHRIDQARHLRRRIDDLVRPGEVEHLGERLAATGQYTRMG